MVLRMRDPFAALLTVQRAMDSVLQRDRFAALAGARGALPPVNVFEQNGDFVLVAELPGVKKEDLDIQVKGDTVRVHGKKTVEYPEDASVHRRERVAGEFDRTLTLPAQIDAAKVTADYRDGVLTLRLPRADSEKPRSVTIN
jgi:HSP20 family protein